ncbi:homeobox domain-containing protein [Caerostris darwini]|uniref:Homeobox domain-containing protein n=1 Tax=Caerostris darwini TaxID=1538125 RepID=A0AAV4U8W6_9ARAC|nr:homeobox domain-containing protein [Caerostris darwini]
MKTKISVLYQYGAGPQLSMDLGVRQLFQPRSDQSRIFQHNSKEFLVDIIFDKFAKMTTHPSACSTQPTTSVTNVSVESDPFIVRIKEEPVDDYETHQNAPSNIFGNSAQGDPQLAVLNNIKKEDNLKKPVNVSLIYPIITLTDDSNEAVEALFSGVSNSRMDNKDSFNDNPNKLYMTKTVTYKHTSGVDKELTLLDSVAPAYSGSKSRMMSKDLETPPLCIISNNAAANGTRNAVTYTNPVNQIARTQSSNGERFLGNNMDFNSFIGAGDPRNGNNTYLPAEYSANKRNELLTKERRSYPLEVNEPNRNLYASFVKNFRSSTTGQLVSNPQSGNLNVNSCLKRAIHMENSDRDKVTSTQKCGRRRKIPKKNIRRFGAEEIASTEDGNSQIVEETRSPSGSYCFNNGEASREINEFSGMPINAETFQENSYVMEVVRRICDESNHPNLHKNCSERNYHVVPSSSSSAKESQGIKMKISSKRKRKASSKPKATRVKKARVDQNLHNDSVLQGSACSSDISRIPVTSADKNISINSSCKKIEEKRNKCPNRKRTRRKQSFDVAVDNIVDGVNYNETFSAGNNLFPLSKIASESSKNNVETSFINNASPSSDLTILSKKESNGHPTLQTRTEEINVAEEAPSMQHNISSGQVTQSNTPQTNRLDLDSNTSSAKTSAPSEIKTTKLISKNEKHGPILERYNVLNYDEHDIDCSYSNEVLQEFIVGNENRRTNSCANNSPTISSGNQFFVSNSGIENISCAINSNRIKERNSECVAFSDTAKNAYPDISNRLENCSLRSTSENNDCDSLNTDYHDTLKKTVNETNIEAQSRNDLQCHSSNIAPQSHQPIEDGNGSAPFAESAKNDEVVIVYSKVNKTDEPAITNGRIDYAELGVNLNGLLLSVEFLYTQDSSNYYAFNLKNKFVAFKSGVMSDSSKRPVANQMKDINNIYAGFSSSLPDTNRGYIQQPAFYNGNKNSGAQCAFSNNSFVEEDDSNFQICILEMRGFESAGFFISPLDKRSFECENFWISCEAVHSKVAKQIIQFSESGENVKILCEMLSDESSCFVYCWPAMAFEDSNSCKFNHSQPAACLSNQKISDREDIFPTVKNYIFIVLTNLAVHDLADFISNNDKFSYLFKNENAVSENSTLQPKTTSANVSSTSEAEKMDLGTNVSSSDISENPTLQPKTNSADVPSTSEAEKKGLSTNVSSSNIACLYSEREIKKELIEHEIFKSQRMRAGEVPLPAFQTCADRENASSTGKRAGDNEREDCTIVNELMSSCRVMNKDKTSTGNSSGKRHSHNNSEIAENVSTYESNQRPSSTFAPLSFTNNFCADVSNSCPPFNSGGDSANVYAVQELNYSSRNNINLNEAHQNSVYASNRSTIHHFPQGEEIKPETLKGSTAQGSVLSAQDFFQPIYQPFQRDPSADLSAGGNTQNIAYFVDNTHFSARLSQDISNPSPETSNSNVNHYEISNYCDTLSPSSSATQPLNLTSEFCQMRMNADQRTVSAPYWTSHSMEVSMDTQRQPMEVQERCVSALQRDADRHNRSLNPLLPPTNQERDPRRREKQNFFCNRFADQGVDRSFLQTSGGMLVREGVTRDSEFLANNNLYPNPFHAVLRYSANASNFSSPALLQPNSRGNLTNFIETPHTFNTSFINNTPFSNELRLSNCRQVPFLGNGPPPDYDSRRTRTPDMSSTYPQYSTGGDSSSHSEKDSDSDGSETVFVQESTLLSDLYNPDMHSFSQMENPLDPSEYLVQNYSYSSESIQLTNSLEINVEDVISINREINSAISEMNEAKLCAFLNRNTTLLDNAQILRIKAHLAFWNGRFIDVKEILRTSPTPFPLVYQNELQNLWTKASQFLEGNYSKSRAKRGFPFPSTIHIDVFKTLNDHYQQDQYPRLSTRILIAQKIGYTEKKVNNWFKNRRQREKNR